MSREVTLQTPCSVARGRASGGGLEDETTQLRHDPSNLRRARRDPTPLCGVAPDDMVGKIELIAEDRSIGFRPPSVVLGSVKLFMPKGEFPVDAERIIRTPSCRAVQQSSLQ